MSAWRCDWATALFIVYFIVCILFCWIDNNVYNTSVLAVMSTLVDELQKDNVWENEEERERWETVVVYRPNRLNQKKWVITKCQWRLFREF